MTITEWHRKSLSIEKEYHLQQVLSVAAATGYLWFSIPIGRLHFAYWSALLSYWSDTNS